LSSYLPTAVVWFSAEAVVRLSVKADFLITG